uniref:Uncharacterized protein n=1 Tax=Anguilla anguilla TaxID=7936 RepID=A0A0E9T6P7_ANGAN
MKRHPPSCFVSERYAFRSTTAPCKRTALTVLLTPEQRLSHPPLNGVC